MLQTYLDDSGTSPNQSTFALGGFVSTVERWEAFTQAWRTVLDGPPRLDYFKFNEATSRVEQFAGWSEADVQRRMLDLADVIRQHVIVRVHCSVFWKDQPVAEMSDFSDRDSPGFKRAQEIDKYVQTWSKLPTRLGKRKSRFKRIRHPYLVCFFTLLFAVHAEQELSPAYRDMQMDIICDEQDDVGKEAAWWYDTFKQFCPPAIRRRIGHQPIFRNDKLFLPLQAADLYVGNMREIINYSRSGLSIPLNKVLRVLWPIHSIGTHFGSEDLTATNPIWDQILANVKVQDDP